MIIKKILYPTLLTIALAACSADKTAEEHIGQANVYLAESNFAAGVIELKNALKKNPQSGQARWLLGSTYLTTGDAISAEKEILHALKLGWPREEAIPTLADSLLAQRKFEDVREINSSGLSPAAQSRIFAAKSMANLHLGKNSESRKLADKALDINPESTPALIARALVFANQGDLAQADIALDTLIDLDSENARVWSLVGDIRTQQKLLKEALEAYNKALVLEPDAPDVLFKRSLLALQLRELDVAKADADNLLARSAQHPGANYVRGILYFFDQEYSQAVSALAVAEPIANSFPLVLYFLAASLLLEEDWEGASIRASRYHEVAPGNVDGRRLLATIRLQQGKVKEVQTLLRPVLEVTPNDVGSLNMMANALLQDNQSDEAITLLAKVAELQPDSAEAQVRLGAGLLMGGDSDTGAEHMEAALKLDPQFQQADIMIALNHLREGDYEAAIASAQGFRLRNPSSATPLNLLGRIYLQQGQPEKAQESFTKALKVEPGNPGANHGLATMAVAENQLEQARARYQDILTHNENNLLALMQLAALDATENKGDSLVSHLERAIDAHPTVVEPRLLLARYQLSVGRPEKVSPLFEPLSHAQKTSPAILRLIAMSQLASAEHQDAQYTLDQLIEGTPNSPVLHHMMAAAANGAGDPERAEQELTLALELDSDYVPARTALAKMLYADTDRTAEFKEHLEILASQAPESAQVAILRSASARRDGNHEDAITYAQQAYDTSPNQTTTLNLASHLIASGDQQSALQLYQDWLAKEPSDNGVRTAYASALQASGDNDAAAQQFSQILEVQPGNPIALNNLAWMLREKEPQRALELALEASRIAIESGEILDTLAVIQYMNKDYTAAQTSIGKALRLLPDNPSLVYHSAMISTARGNRSEAAKVLEKLINRDIDFPELAEARKLLQDLQNPASE